MGRDSLLRTPTLSTGGESENLKLNKNGYWEYIRIPVGCVKLVHRSVYFSANPGGCRLWHVHHIDGNKVNNDLKNLILLKPVIHNLLHKNWRMWELPTRAEILRWIGQGHRLAKKSKKKKKKGKRKWKTKVPRQYGQYFIKKTDAELDDLRRRYINGQQLKQKQLNHPQVKEVLRKWEEERLWRCEPKLMEAKTNAKNAVIVRTKTGERRINGPLRNSRK